jgi:NitT/TauT family transport system permease protein
MRRVLDRLAPLILAAALVLAWGAAVRLFELPPYILPGPGAVFAALIGRWPDLLSAAFVTLGMALSGLALAAVVAGALALLTGVSDTAERALRPLAVAVQVTPVVALGPLVVLWAGLDHPGRAVAVLAAVVAFFPLFSGLATGLRSADRGLEQLFDLYGAGRIQRLLRLRLPAAAPHALEGLRVAAGLSVVGAVVAEFVAGSGSSQGLAWRILEAGNRLRTAEMFAAVLVLAALGYLLNGLIAAAERRLLETWSGRTAKASR